MNTYTVACGPDRIPQITPGLSVSLSGSRLCVELGGYGRLASRATLSLWQGNVPNITTTPTGDKVILNAYPMEHTIQDYNGRLFTDMELVNPLSSSSGLLMVRFEFASSVSEKLRGCAWPEEGHPDLLAYCGTGITHDVWPLWHNDSVWSMSQDDTIHITLSSKAVWRCRMENNSLTLKKIQETS